MQGRCATYAGSAIRPAVALVVEDQQPGQSCEKTAPFRRYLARIVSTNSGRWIAVTVLRVFFRKRFCNTIVCRACIRRCYLWRGLDYRLFLKFVQGYLLIELGRKTFLARNPRCPQCCILNLCPHGQAKLAETGSPRR